MIRFSTLALSVLLFPGRSLAATPRIEIVTDAQGFRRFSAGGKSFTPIGVNYLYEHTGAPYQTFDMFDTSADNLATADRDFASLAREGFNFVRLWLKGLDTDAGFDSAPFKISDAYAAKVLRTMQTARRHGLRVVLTGSFPKNGLWVPKNYLPETPLPPVNVVGGMNRLILLPEMARSTGRFYHDLLVKLEATDPDIADEIFYFDLYNELHFDLNQPPFSKHFGEYRFGGQSYDLGNPTSRQALMDRAAQAWIKAVVAEVRPAAPRLLTTASSSINYGNPGFDGGWAAVQTGKKAPSFILRPSAIISGGADIIDIHMYPGPARSGLTASHERLAAGFRLNEITTSTARQAPLIAGEFGAFMGKFPTPAGAAAEMAATVAASCPFHFTGFAFWAVQNVKGQTWSLNDDNDALLRALAPRYHPNYCGAAAR
jgi:hypothetical protein